MISAVDPAPILEVDCLEPEGKVTRAVRFMPLSVGNLRTLWERARQFDTLFGEEINSDFQRFLEVVIRMGPEGIEPTGLFWVVDDFVGMFYLTHIIPEQQADVHYSFFDRRHKGRITLVREMLKFAFKRYGFVRVNAWIPVYATEQAFKFVAQLGFKDEGKKRKAAFYKGKYFDVVLFGLLREEALG